MRLRVADFSDSAFIYSVRNHPEVRAWCRNSHEIAWSEHEAWYAAKLDDAQMLILIGEEDGRAVGYVRLETHWVELQTIELSYAVLPELWGCGYMSDLLKLVVVYAVQQWGHVCLQAETRLENAASRSLLASAGFRPQHGNEAWMELIR